MECPRRINTLPGTRTVPPLRMLHSCTENRLPWPHQFPTRPPPGASHGPPRTAQLGRFQGEEEGQKVDKGAVSPIPCLLPNRATTRYASLPGLPSSTPFTTQEVPSSQRGLRHKTAPFCAQTTLVVIPLLQGTLEAVSPNASVAAG